MVRGGGETRKKTAIAFALSFITAIMLAMPVVAGPMRIIVSDRPGDIGRIYNDETGEPTNTWPDDAPIAKAGYVDMVSAWLEKKGGTYTFGMELAKALPEEGEALVPGVQAVRWNLWIETAAWTPDNPVQAVYSIWLMYYESTYAAALLDTAVWEYTMLPFSIDGAELEIQFSDDMIGDLSSFWFSYGTVVFFGWGGFCSTDNVDPGAYPGQIFWDIPWRQ